MPGSDEEHDSAMRSLEDGGGQWQDGVQRTSRKRQSSKEEQENKIKKTLKNFSFQITSKQNIK